jgi:hypothetical protein
MNTKVFLMILALVGGYSSASAAADSKDGFVFCPTSPLIPPIVPVALFANCTKAPCTTEVKDGKTIYWCACRLEYGPSAMATPSDPSDACKPATERRSVPLRPNSQLSEVHGPTCVANLGVVSGRRLLLQKSRRGQLQMHAASAEQRDLAVHDRAEHIQLDRMQRQSGLLLGGNR